MTFTALPLAGCSRPPGRSTRSAGELDTIRRDAERGEVAAQTALGISFSCGDGAAQDDAMAARLYRAAAGRGFAMAQYQLGLAYLSGRGVSQDPEQAAEWIRKAAAQKMAVAQRRLGTFYSTGRGVPQDHALAFAWWLQAAELGDIPAMNLALQDYERRHDYGGAGKWSMVAAAKGDPHGTYKLAEGHFRGDREKAGIEQSNFKGYKLLLVAAGTYVSGVVRRQLRPTPCDGVATGET